MAINSKVCLQLFTLALMTTGAFSQNVGKLVSKLKLVPDNFLFSCGLVVLFLLFFILQIVLLLHLHLLLFLLLFLLLLVHWKETIALGMSTTLLHCCRTLIFHCSFDPILLLFVLVLLLLLLLLLVHWKETIALAHEYFYMNSMCFASIESVQITCRQL